MLGALRLESTHPLSAAAVLKRLAITREQFKEREMHALLKHDGSIPPDASDEELQGLRLPAREGMRYCASSVLSVTELLASDLPVRVAAADLPSALTEPARELLFESGRWQLLAHQQDPTAGAFLGAAAKSLGHCEEVLTELTKLPADLRPELDKPVRRDLAFVTYEELRRAKESG